VHNVIAINLIEWLALLLNILDFPNSNIGLQTGFPNSDFYCSNPSSSEKFWYSTRYSYSVRNIWVLVEYASGLLKDWLE
jgi:hypothetical protein